MATIKGRVWKYGDDVNTDVIFPGKYTYTVSDPKEMAQYALEDLDPRFATEVKPGDIIVAGKNWGNGSSREQAVICLKEAGVAAIVARSFARIYGRNCINSALLALTCPQAVDAIEDGEVIEIDLAAGQIRCAAGTFHFPPLPANVLAIVEAGGLINYTRQQLKAQRSKRTIVLMPGDGIGKIVLPEALRVLEAVGFEADYVQADIGWEFWRKEGNPLPQRTIELLAEYKIGLFGAITSKPKAEAEAELAPELKDKGYVYYSPIVGLRQHFNLDICVRPCQTFKGNPLNFIRRGADGGIEEPEIDVVVFRQNTEGLYSGVEWTNPPDQVYNALMTHPNFKKFAGVPRTELAVSTRIFTQRATERIVRAAFEHAKKFGYKSVTVCEKPNVIRETSGMMLAMGKKISKEYDGIALWDTNIDAQMMWLTKNPEDYGLIVAGNMFGDIISDGFAGLVGGLGFACSANIGQAVAIFEPTHGSAPKYAEYQIPIVNPIAMILSACMMLDHLGETEKATKIRGAIAEVVAAGRVRTYDMMKLRGSPQVVEQGAASTSQMTDAIIEML